MDYQVKGCKDCPCRMTDEFEQYSSYIICAHPSNPELHREASKDYKDDNYAPYWCPLNYEPITISRKV